MFCCVFEWVLGRLEFNVSWFLLLLRLCFDVICGNVKAHWKGNRWEQSNGLAVLSVLLRHFWLIILLRLTSLAIGIWFLNTFGCLSALVYLSVVFSLAMRCCAYSFLFIYFFLLILGFSWKRWIGFFFSHMSLFCLSLSFILSICAPALCLRFYTLTVAPNHGQKERGNVFLGWFLYFLFILELEVCFSYLHLSSP